jgi:hypothetical protein
MHLLHEKPLVLYQMKAIIRYRVLFFWSFVVYRFCMQLHDKDLQMLVTEQQEIVIASKLRVK